MSEPKSSSNNVAVENSSNKEDDKKEKISKKCSGSNVVVDQERHSKKLSTNKLVKEVVDNSSNTNTNNNENALQTKVSKVAVSSSTQLESQKIKDLENQLKEAEEKLKLLTEDKNKQIEAKNLELQSKEKTLLALSNTNKKLIQNLEVMKKEVDEKLEKISLKAIHEKMKPKVDNPLEIIVKVKEKEIKNAHAKNDILKNDLKKLEMYEKLDYYNMYLEASDRVKCEEKRNQDLLNEIKLLNRFDEDNKKNIEKIKEFDKERKNFRDEIIKLKDKTKDLQKSLKDEENKYNIMSTKLNNKIYEDAAKALGKRRSLTPKNRNSSPDKVQKDEKTSKELKEKDGKDRENKSTKKIIKGQLITNANMNIYSRNSKYSEEEKCLFSQEQLTKLENVFEKSEIEKLEKKYEASVSSKYSLDNRLRSDAKLSAKTISELQEQLEFITIQLRESDQKNKINIHQINEYKQESKQLTKKLNETQQTLDGITKILREKEQENNIILNQLSNLKKISKHNILAPLDAEYSRREKSKMSEMNDSKFSPPRKNKLEDIDKLNSSKDSVDMDNLNTKTKTPAKSPIKQTEGNENLEGVDGDQRYNLRPQKNKGLDS